MPAAEGAGISTRVNDLARAGERRQQPVQLIGSSVRMRSRYARTTSPPQSLHLAPLEAGLQVGQPWENPYHLVAVDHFQAHLHVRQHDVVGARRNEMDRGSFAA